MVLLASLLVGLLAGSVSGQACVPYNAACTNTSMCCNNPSGVVVIACLPDARNGTSCLSPVDLLNLSPSLTGLNLLLPLVPANASAVVKEVVQVNGNTVYNATQTVLPNAMTASGTLGPATTAGGYYAPSASAPSFSYPPAG